MEDDVVVVQVCLNEVIFLVVRDFSLGEYKVVNGNLNLNACENFGNKTSYNIH